MNRHERRKHASRERSRFGRIKRSIKELNRRSDRVSHFDVEAHMAKRGWLYREETAQTIKRTMAWILFGGGLYQ